MKQFTENHMDNYNQKTEICYISIKKGKRQGLKSVADWSILFNDISNSNCLERGVRFI